MAQVVEVAHPLVAHHLTRLRDVDTRPEEFRRLVARLAVLLAYEATKDLTLEDVRVQTPLMETGGKQLSQRIGLAPIMRAGLGMVGPILDLIPSAEVWHLGLYRDEETAQPVQYYSKLPGHAPVDLAMVIDPMLATGGSVSAAIELLGRWGAKSVSLLSILAAPEGIAAVHEKHPDVRIHVCAIDQRLNDRKFIVPGLGDAGDRIFSTPS
jgi:uracil phosphoribosyltransferase